MAVYATRIRDRIVVQSRLTGLFLNRNFLFARTQASTLVLMYFWSATLGRNITITSSVLPCEAAIRHFWFEVLIISLLRGVNPIMNQVSCQSKIFYLTSMKKFCTLGTLKASLNLKIIKQPSLRRMVYEKLKDAILSGTIPRGARLYESKLAEEMGISRTPVREALHALEREMLISTIDKVGYEINDVDPEDLEEISEIRKTVELWR